MAIAEDERDVVGVGQHQRDIEAARQREAPSPVRDEPPRVLDLRTADVRRTLGINHDPGDEDVRR